MDIKGALNIKNLGSAMKYFGLAQTVVEGVQTIFGKGNGAEKKAAAMDALSASIAVYEGIINKDHINDPVVLSIMSDLIELVLKSKKDIEDMEARLRTAIDLAKHNAKGTDQPVE